MFRLRIIYYYYLSLDASTVMCSSSGRVAQKQANTLLSSSHHCILELELVESFSRGTITQQAGNIIIIIF